ncbi:MAG: thiamine-monophosphate kinase [Thermoanaerobaculia bacterium]|jgi:thiamine-monophosphate kinase|nr:thiamine-monophosphate kinase [Thermoanaerobaculia bacterium]
MSERDLIERIRALFPRAGDDAAVIGNQLITNDVLVENVDFTRAIPLRLIARKSLTVNLSDIAAMGGRPRYAVVAIGSANEADASTIIEELAIAAKENDVEIVGGDLSRSELLFISVTLIGEASQPILRSGARRGDRIYLSRPIGGSAAGLSFLQRGTEGGDYAEREFIESAKRRHLEPEAEVALGMKLAGVATSCIDVSDGFSTDLHHLCDASNVGALIDGDRIPPFADLPRFGPRLGINVRDAVLHGGEEYALLFTSAMRESELSARVGRPVYAIGRITEERGVRINGEILEPGGFDHFA